MYLKYIIIIVFFILFINILTFKKSKREDYYGNGRSYKSLPRRHKETFIETFQETKEKTCILDIKKFSNTLSEPANINTNNICLDKDVDMFPSLVSLNIQEKGDAYSGFEDNNDFLYKDLPEHITKVPTDNKYGLYQINGYFGSVVEAKKYNRNEWPLDNRQTTIFENCNHGITGGTLEKPSLKKCIEHINKPQFWSLVNRASHRDETLLEKGKRLTEIYSVGINMLELGPRTYTYKRSTNGYCALNKPNSCIYYGVTKDGYNPSTDPYRNFQSTFISRPPLDTRSGRGSFKTFKESSSFKFIVPKKIKKFHDFMCINNKNVYNKEVQTNETCFKLYNQIKNRKNIKYIHKDVTGVLDSFVRDSLIKIRESLKMYPGCRYIETQKNNKYITFIESLDTVKHVFDNEDIIDFNKNNLKILPRKLCAKDETTLTLIENDNVMSFLTNRLKNKNISTPTASPFICLFINSDSNCENLNEITDIITDPTIQKGPDLLYKFTHIDYKKDEIGRQIIYNELELQLGITELPVILLYEGAKKYRYNLRDSNINAKKPIINATTNRDLFKTWVKNHGTPVLPIKCGSGNGTGPISRGICGNPQSHTCVGLPYLFNSETSCGTTGSYLCCPSAKLKAIPK